MTLSFIVFSHVLPSWLSDWWNSMPQNIIFLHTTFHSTRIGANKSLTLLADRNSTAVLQPASPRNSLITTFRKCRDLSYAVSTQYCDRVRERETERTLVCNKLLTRTLEFRQILNLMDFKHDLQKINYQSHASVSGLKFSTGPTSLRVRTVPILIDFFKNYY